MDISLKFNGVNEIIRVIDEGGNIMKLLGKESQDCPLIGSEIYINKELGKGKQGGVFSIKFSNGLEANFVVKIQIYRTNQVRLYRKDADHSYEEIINNIIMSQRLGSKYDVLSIMKFNNLGTNLERKYDIKSDPNIIYIPNFMPLYSCKLEQPKTIKDKLTKTKITIPAGSYVCNSIIVEKVISAFISKIIEEGICPHYIHTFSFAQCDAAKSFIFMEEIDGPSTGDIFRKEILSSLASFEAFIFQVFVAIYVMQKAYSIAHQDLHLNNIFLKNSASIVWKNQRLDSKSHWRYDIDEDSYYFPTQKYLVKLGDWGAAAKYSFPFVLRADILEGKFDKANVPKNMIILHDYIYFIYRTDMWISTIDSSLKSDFLNKINRIKTSFVGSIDTFNNLIDPRSKRPILLLLEKIQNKPIKWGLSKIFEKYKMPTQSYLQII
jgi:hypothetical protein